MLSPDVMQYEVENLYALPKTSDLNLSVPLDLTPSWQEIQGQVKWYPKETIRQISCETLLQLSDLVPSKGGGGKAREEDYSRKENEEI